MDWVIREMMIEINELKTQYRLLLAGISVVAFTSVILNQLW